MNKKVLQKIQKRGVAFVLAFAMIITGLYVLEPKGSVANAAAGEDLFAGYYTDATYETPSKTETDYEKQVNSDVLSVKLQVKKDSTGKYDMRVITTVDDLNYRTVGFEVYFGDAAKNPSSDNVIKFETATVLERINAKTTGVEYNYSPKVVDTDSEYFVTGTIKGIHPKYVEVAGSEAPFYIKPFWTTLDGTKVYGESRYFTLQDGLKATNINMSVKADGISGDTVTVAVDGTNVTADAVYTEDGYAHLNIPVTNKTALKSATKIVVGGLTTYYRNLETSYNGTADTSWYTVCKEAGDTEFVIATSADLYGLGTLNSFNSTVYMVSDIEVNKDAPDSEGGWDSFISSNNPKKWTPIEKFAGTFDGQGHVVKGMYINDSTGSTYVGMFNWTTVKATIQDFKLTNSYFKKTAGNGMGAITGVGAGTFRNIYTDVIMHSSVDKVGGIIGLVHQNGSYAEEVIIENCWSNCDITTTRNMVGGMFGDHFGFGFSIKNCLNTGDIHHTGKVEGYLGGIVGKLENNNANSDRWVMENCLNIGSVSTASTYDRIGAISGWTNASTVLDTYKNIYYLDSNADKAIGLQQSSISYSGQTTALTLEALSGDAAMQGCVGFDFENVWATTEDGVPVLRGFEEYASEAQPDGKVKATIGTLAELQAFVSSASSYTSKQKVKLTANIVVNEGSAEDWAEGKNLPTSSWAPISSFAGIFDGQGYSIKGIYIENSTNAYMGLFRYTTNTAVVKNLKLLNGYYHTTNGTAMGGITGYGGGTYQNIYTDIIMSSTKGNVGGILGYNYPNGDWSDQTIFENCWNNSDITTTAFKAGGILGNGVSFGFVIKNCLNSGDIYYSSTSGNEYLGGLVGSMGGNYNLSDTWIIENCLNVGTISSACSTGAIGGIIGEGNTKPTRVANNYYLDNSARKSVGGNDTGGSATKCKAISMYSLIGNAAKSGLPEFDFEKVWTTIDNGMPVLRMFATYADEAMPEEKVAMTIMTLDDLKAFAETSKTNDFFGQTVKLGADIIVNEGDATEWAKGNNLPTYTWTPISATKAFAGTFDGQGYTIQGLYINATTSNYAGLFRQTSDTAVIKNLKITNSYYTTSTGNGMGAITGYGGGTYKNIYTDVIMKSTHINVGGILGYNYASQGKKTVIENCWSNCDITTSVNNAGGIIGNGCGRGFEIKNCLNSGTIISTKESAQYIGGFIGTMGNWADSNSPYIIENCLNVGEISTTSDTKVLGAIIGEANSLANRMVNLYYLNTSAIADLGRNGYPDNAGKCTALTLNNLTGDTAKNYCFGFDFEKVWATVDEGTPILKYFAE